MPQQSVRFPDDLHAAITAEVQRRGYPHSFSSVLLDWAALGQVAALAASDASEAIGRVGTVKDCQDRYDEAQAAYKAAPGAGTAMVLGDARNALRAANEAEYWANHRIGTDDGEPSPASLPPVTNFDRLQGVEPRESRR